MRSARLAPNSSPWRSGAAFAAVSFPTTLSAITDRWASVSSSPQGDDVPAWLAVPSSPTHDFAARLRCSYSDMTLMPTYSRSYTETGWQLIEQDTLVLADPLSCICIWEHTNEFAVRMLRRTKARYPAHRPSSSNVNLVLLTRLNLFAKYCQKWQKSGSSSLCRLILLLRFLAILCSHLLPFMATSVL